MNEFHTAAETIRAVGGTSAFARWWGVNKQTADQWRRRGFPSALFLSMSDRLRRELSVNASPAAWNMRQEAAE